MGGNIYLRDGCIIIERECANACHAVGDQHFFQTMQMHECPAADRGNAAFDFDPTDHALRFTAASIRFPFPPRSVVFLHWAGAADRQRSIVADSPVYMISA